MGTQMTGSGEPATRLRVRRMVLRMLSGALVVPRIAASAPLEFVSLAAPQPVAQIHVDGARLLAVSRDGRLRGYVGGRWAELGAGLDPRAPLASGHGRIAGRSAAGTLWILEGGRALTAAGPVLAPHAGFCILAFGVIAVAQAGERAGHAVRLEPGSGSVWTETARSGDPVLPDARPLQVDLGPGRGDDGHIAVLAGPDDARISHGVLGDRIEATRLLYLERHGLAPLRGLDLPAPHVFEDIAPRPIAWHASRALLTVRSGPQGAQLAVVAADPARSDALALAALGEPIGTANRWMAPTTDGRRLLSVHTPHIGGVLHDHRVEGGRLASRAVAAGVSTHAIGSRELDLAAWAGARLVLPAQDRRRLRVLDGADGWAERASVAVPAAVAASHAFSVDGRPGCAVLLEDGSVGWIAATA